MKIIQIFFFSEFHFLFQVSGFTLPVRKGSRFFCGVWWVLCELISVAFLAAHVLLPVWIKAVIEGTSVAKRGAYLWSAFCFRQWLSETFTQQADHIINSRNHKSAIEAGKTANIGSFMVCSVSLKSLT